MGYIGNTPAEKYITLSKQTFTPDSSTVAFTLDNPVANENELAVFVNNVRQEPGSGKAYTATGTTLTMSEAPTSGHAMYAIYLGKTMATNTPAAGSVTHDMLASGAFSNITGTGTLINFASTGIDDNADATAITIDSSGNVGIGTGSPDGSSFSGSSSPVLDVSGTRPLIILSETDANTKKAWLGLSSDQFFVGGTNTDTLFYTNNTEKMRIQSNGTIQLATAEQSISNYTTNPGNWVSNETDGGQDFRVGTLVTSADASVIHIVNKTTTGSGNMMAFRVQGSTKGTISTDGSSTAYNTTSDYRLKENIVNVSDGITRVKQLQPKRFNWIEDETNTLIDGFLAHEVSSIVPEAVNGEKDAVSSDSTPIYQGIDQSKLVPLLTACLKEAITKIETLESENTSIKSRLDALEG